MRQTGSLVVHGYPPCDRQNCTEAFKRCPDFVRQAGPERNKRPPPDAPAEVTGDGRRFPNAIFAQLILD